MQLEMFVAVAEEHSVRGASERVFRTQSAVSIAVRKLEEECETALFDRSKRYEYRLTEAGESLYAYAKRMLDLRSEAAAALGDICNLRAGRLRIGANESISLYLLPRIAEAFLKQHPRVRMEMKCERSEDLLVDLKDRGLDLALVSFRPDGKDFDSRFMARDELVLITHPGHSLAKKERIEVGDLSKESLLVMDVSRLSPWHKKIADAFVKRNVPLHLMVENAPIETIKKMVAIGLGVSFVPLMCVRKERQRGELAVLEVEGLHEERSVWIVRRRAVHSHAAKEFMEVAVRLEQRGFVGEFLPAREGLTSGRSKIVSVRQRA